MHISINKKPAITTISVVCTAKMMLLKYCFLAPVSPLCLCICTRLSVCSPPQYMCAGICAGERECVFVDVCPSSTVNIVLCSSSSSSFGSAVAACSTVYFPSWRTNSYQISRHCLRACCPTTCSQRISHPLSSGLAHSTASDHSWWLTALWATHISVLNIILILTAVISGKMSSVSKDLCP